MKKTIYSFLALLLVFASCNPLEDVYDELDSQQQGTGIIGDIAFKMTEDDYALAAPGETAIDTLIRDNAAFLNFDQAAEKIPTMLEAKFPVWDNGSSASVSFDYDLLSSVLTEEEYTVTTEDYDSQGGNIARFDSFSSESQLITFMNYKYPDAVRGDLIELTYEYFSGSTNTTTSKFVYTDEWILPYEVTGDDYTAMGQRFPNFGDFDEASFKIGRYLATLPANLFAEEGEVKNVLYTYTYRPSGGSRQFEDVLISFTYEVGEWKTNDNTIQFGKENNVWVKDNTIKYTFSAGDYTTVGNSSVLAADANFADALDNLNNFGNFNRNNGSTHWSDEMMITAIGIVLNDINPSATDGQKYQVTVNVWIGAASTEVFSLVKEAGEWIAQP